MDLIMENGAYCTKYHKNIALNWVGPTGYQPMQHGFLARKEESKKKKVHRFAYSNESCFYNIRFSLDIDM